MALIDWMIPAVYGVAMIGLSIYLSRGQTSEEDYYVGGRDLPWWAVGISTMATQTSAVSFISIEDMIQIEYSLEAGITQQLSNTLILQSNI